MFPRPGSGGLPGSLSCLHISVCCTAPLPIVPPHQCLPVQALLSPKPPIYPQLLPCLLTFLAPDLPSALACPQHMLPFLCRGLNLENIFLDSEENMKVPISRFSRRVIVPDVSGESPSPHQGLPTKAALSQSFCQSYAYSCTDIGQEKTFSWQARGHLQVIFCTLLWGLVMPPTCSTC